MHEIEKLVDISGWTGNWPFIHLRYGELAVLKQKLQSLNVVKAFVAPIEGILEQDPMRADKQLLSLVKDDFFSPVPIIDLSYGNWEECMEVAARDGRVEMVKLLPNYHMYNLSDKKFGSLVALTLKNHMVISLQMRVDDRRSQNFPLKVDDIKVSDVVRAISAFPEQTFILNNVLMPEVEILAESLDNIYLDIACIEQQDTLEELFKKCSPDRVLFGSHCPFFYPEGALYKLKYSRLEMGELEKVMYKNAGRIFNEKRGFRR